MQREPQIACLKVQFSIFLRSTHPLALAYSLGFSALRASNKKFCISTLNRHSPVGDRISLKHFVEYNSSAPITNSTKRLHNLAKFSIDFPIFSHIWHASAMTVTCIWKMQAERPAIHSFQPCSVFHKAINASYMYFYITTQRELVGSR